MKALRYILVTLSLTFTLALTLPTVNAQCPMCKASIESNSGGAGEDGSAIAEGVNDGIMYLFAIPYLAVMTIGILWFRGYRRRKREEARDEMTTVEDFLHPES